MTNVEGTLAIVECNPLILQLRKLRPRKKRQIQVNDRSTLKPRLPEWVEGFIHYSTLHRATETDTQARNQRQGMSNLYLVNFYCIKNTRLTKKYPAVLQELNISLAGEKIPGMQNSNHEKRYVATSSEMCSRRSE